MKYHRIGKGGEKTKAKRAAAIFFTDGKSVLLLKRAGEGDHIGKWGLPGGKAKDGESQIAAAQRETKEETGVSSIPGHRVDTVENKNGHQIFTAYIYKVQKPFDVHLSKEHSEGTWFAIEELKSIDLHPKFKEQLPRYLTAARRSVRDFKEWSTMTEAVSWLIEQSCD